MIDSFWRGGDSPPGRSSGPDLLAEERERRRSKVRLAWPGNWFTGRFGLVVLVVFVGGGLGWSLFQTLGARFDSRSSSAVSDVLHPESGRDLTVAEYALAEQYGQPVFLGDGGMPLIQVEATGEVREITPVEAGV